MDGEGDEGERDPMDGASSSPRHASADSILYGTHNKHAGLI